MVNISPQKKPDLAVQVTNDSSTLETKLVVKIGFSQDHDDLIEDVNK